MIVERNDLRAVRQLQVGDLRLDLLDDLLPILPSQNDDHAGDRLTLAVAHDRTITGQSGRLDRCDLLQQDGNAVGGGHDDITQVVDPLCPAQPTHGVLLLCMLDIAAAEVGIVVRHGRDHIMQSQVEATQIFRVHLRGVLLSLAAPGVDLTDAWNGEQGIPDNPVMQGLDLHERHLRRGHRVLIDLTEGRGHRVHLRLQTCRDAALYLVDSLRNELPHKIFVHRIVEDDGDHGQVELGRGTHHLQLRHAHHGGLDGVGYELLHLNRRHAWALHCYNNLIVGEVGKSLKRQVQHDREPANHQHRQESDNKPPVREKEVDQFTHPSRPPSCP